MNASEAEHAAQAEELLVLVRDARVTSYAAVAALALLLFDYSLTFAQEVDLVWKRRFTWGKALFLVTRYFGLFSHVFNTAVYLNNTADTDFCLFATRFQTGSSNAVLWLVELTLALRVWLLYNRSLIILFSLGPLYICSITTVTVICVKGLFHHTLLKRPSPFLSGCYGEIPSYFFSVLIAPAVTTSVLMVLTVHKTLQTMKDTGYQKLPMVTLLLRDGILNFIAVFGVLVVNILVFKLARFTLAAFGAEFIIVVPCMTGSRLFLNIRERLLHPNATTIQSISTLKMSPHGPSFEVTADLEFSRPATASPQNDCPEPDSATTLVDNNTPWSETTTGIVGESV